MTAVLETDFGLRVTYDWNWHLVLDLPSSYSEQTCGLCGNFNLQPGDDVPLQGGDELAASIVSWASTWKVPDEDPFCWDFCNGDCPVCEEGKKELYSGNQHCGLIKKSFQGPFRACHGIVSPRDFFQNCLYDVCMSGGDKKILCKTLETYASTCRKNGAVVYDWRTPAGCRVRRCVAVGRSVCVATGDPHYTTFDGRRFDFMGTCVYRFAALCSDDPTLVPFEVTVENNHRGSRAVSYTKEVTLKVYNVTFSLSQAEPKKMKVWKKEGEKGLKGP
ncbi:UNVERIFIED_CONTAM: hypothetical protein H355_003682 [Colinus virginianus]|nr:hypothetical protein H355_003682 [Colinus virginianus]